MNLFTIIAASFCMVSMTACCKEQTKDERPEYIKYVDDISYEVIAEVQNELGLECGGTGGRMSRDVEEIALIFYSPYPTSIETARELEIEIMRKLVDKVNNHEKIRPFLREYPFTLERSDISISFPRTRDSKLKNVELTFNAKGKIFYKKNNPKTDKYENLLTETIEDAIKVLENKPKESPK